MSNTTKVLAIAATVAAAVAAQATTATAQAHSHPARARAPLALLCEQRRALRLRRVSCPHDRPCLHLGAHTRDHPCV